MLKLPKTLRREMRIPFGTLHKSVDLIEESLQKQLSEDKLIIAVGDVTSINLVELGIIPQICIVDNITKRQPIEHNLNHTTNIKYVKNPSGVLTDRLLEICRDCINEATVSNQIMIEVDGEEDLAVLPCIIYSPKDTMVLYGQPDEGVVLVNVDEAYDRAYNYYKQLIKE